jgi:general secretion pathway protein K
MTPRAKSIRRRSRKRGVALILVLGALTILTVMLAEFQDGTSAELGSALSHRDGVRAEYAAKSGVNLTRLLIAAEPTIRKGLAPLFLLMRQGPPQIPVWEYADQVLGAFNDDTGRESFASLSGVNIEEGKNLGITGAGFQVKVVDEDAKINVNMAARGDAFSQNRLAQQLIGLLVNPQYDKLFENRDADGQFSDRQAICAALVDWSDPDQDAYVCDPHSTSAQQAGAEDSFYQLLKKPYPRKNAAFDSLEELRLVRGIGDDFWTSFVDPDPDDPTKRVMTVWGQGKPNVNSANAQTIWALICGYVVNPQSTPLCSDPVEAAKFISVVTMVRGFTAGLPIFGSPKAFVNTITGKGKAGSMFGILAETMGIQPVQFHSDNEMMKGISTESKVFSLYSTGFVKAGKRETRVRVHAVVDFREAPPPGVPAQAADAVQDALRGLIGSQPGGQNLPDGATDSAIAAIFAPNPGGNILYYRVD